jgi:hypothetical protein
MSIGLTGKDDGTTPPTGDNGIGVLGTSSAGAGVVGTSQSNDGVHGTSETFTGVQGTSFSGTGVFGSSNTGTGVMGTSQGDKAAVVGGASRAAGVHGESVTGPGVKGSNSSNAIGLLAGQDPIFGQHAGVYGESDQQGVMGIGTVAGSTGIYGSTKNGDGFGLRGETTSGIAIQGKSFGNGLAGRFEGNVEVTGDITLSGADCAENFRTFAAGVIEPGTVMVIRGDGLVEPCSREMDAAVAGVVSGAGGHKAAIVLDRDAGTEAVPLALFGKVYVKADASSAPISAGDLLVTSSTPGHAMRLPQDWAERRPTSGLVLGKALASLVGGRGLIPTLVILC